MPSASVKAKPAGGARPDTSAGREGGERAGAARAQGEAAAAGGERPQRAAPDHSADALLEGLNPPQREAVTHAEGPLLILAGAGSGKTRVLTHRLAYLLRSGLARPEEILAITFTNKAATEMRTRVERLLGGHARRVWLSTFHAACARILRAHAERLGYTSSFTIYDASDARRLVKRAIEELGIDPKRNTPAAVHARISQAKNLLIDPRAYRALGGGPFEQAVADVYDRYERDLQRANAMDFDDLLLLAVALLERHPDVRERYAHSFRHILVDEYQDTNHAQYRLLRLIVEGAGPGGQRGAVELPEGVQAREAGAPEGADTWRGHRNLAVVGDDAQSIYGFRGADIRNILDFQRDFPDATVVKLEQNYRSTQRILDAANALIAHNRGAMRKRLWSALGDGAAVRLTELHDEHAEARFVAGEIERRLEQGTPPGQIAVFYRTNAMSRVLEDRLVRSQIAYQVIGGAKFYERAEIKDAIAYLAVLANPHDTVAFMRAVGAPRRGVGQASLERLVAHAASLGIPIFEAAGDAEHVGGLSGSAIRGLRAFAQTMGELRARARAGEPVADLLSAVLSRSGYVKALEADAEGDPLAEGRLENLEQLVQVARELDRATPGGGATLEAFLQQVSLSAAADEPQRALTAGGAGPPGARGDGNGVGGEDAGGRPDAAGEASRDEGLVTLTTLHNAKGSEFPVVFIVGCEDGVIPHARALDEGATEEERRLMYVGMTRAMRELHLSYARRRAGTAAGGYALRSRFLDELPAELLDADAPAARSAPPVRFGDRPGRSARLRRPPALLGPGGSDPAAGGRGEVDGVRARDGAGRGEESAPRFRIGEDVVHESFGEGVVTGVQPGGVIVVRFARGSAERTLLAEYARPAKR
jgi:DNA helicase-2/ATP-dependent DNA helicase PcrA